MENSKFLQKFRDQDLRTWNFKLKGLEFAIYNLANVEFKI